MAESRHPRRRKTLRHPFHSAGIALLLTAAYSANAFADRPALLRASPLSSNVVQLSWINKTAGMAGFAIERSDAVQSNVFSEIVRVSTNTLTWNNTAAVTGKMVISYRLFAYSASSTSDYSDVVTVMTPAGPADTWDPGDNIGPGATVLSNPAFVARTHGPHALSADDVYDGYAVRLTNGLTYNFSSAGGSGNPVAELYTDNGAFFRVAFDDDSAGDSQFSLTHTATTTAWHYLRVRAYVPGHAAAHNLTWSRVVANATDVWDAADWRPSGATVRDPTNSIEWTHGPHTLSPVDTNDWLRFNLPPATPYVITSEGAGDTYGELFMDTSGTNRIDFDDDSGGAGQFRIRYTPGAFTQVWLKVRTSPPGSNAEYRIRISREADPWDPADNIIAGATALGTPGPVDKTHGPHRLLPWETGFPADVTDWFSVKLTTGAAYVIRSSGHYGNPYANLRSTNNTLLLADDDSAGDGQFELAFTNQWGTGTYYIEVHANAFSDYTLHYRQGADAWDPGDDQRTTATAIGEPQKAPSAHGPHILSAADVEDWFALPLTQGMQYVFSASVTRGDPLGRLYSPLGDFITEDDDSGERLAFRIVYTPTNSGTYAVRVSAAAAGTVVSYDLLTARAFDGDLDQMPDDWETATLGSTTNAGFGTDDDGDGMLDFTEYIADTDPAESNRYFSLAEAAVVQLSGTNIVLSWESATNRVYDLDRGATLIGFEPLATNIAALPPVNTYTAAAPNNLGYFRLRVRNTAP